MSRPTAHPIKDATITGGGTVSAAGTSAVINTFACSPGTVLVAIHADTNVVGATKTIDLLIYGRVHPSAEWVLVDTIDETDSLWTTVSGNTGTYREVQAFPQMLLQISGCANQTDPTTVNVWITL